MTQVPQSMRVPASIALQVLKRNLLLRKQKPLEVLYLRMQRVWRKIKQLVADHPWTRKQRVVQNAETLWLAVNCPSHKGRQLTATVCHILAPIGENLVTQQPVAHLPAYIIVASIASQFLLIALALHLPTPLYQNAQHLWLPLTILSPYSAHELGSPPRHKSSRAEWTPVVLLMNCCSSRPALSVPPWRKKLQDYRYMYTGAREVSL